MKTITSFKSEKFTFHLESKLGLIDTFSIYERNRTEAKKLAKKYLKAEFKKNFPKGDFNITYII